MTYRIAIYARRSEQLDEQSRGGTSSQKEELERYVQEQKRKNPNYGDIVDYFIDDAVSAKNLKRPALQRLFASVACGAVNHVLCTEVSRLVRVSADLHSLQAFLMKHGATFVCIRQNFDETTSHGKFTLLVAAASAQLERDIIIERTRASTQSRMRQGLWTGGLHPFGYKKASGKNGGLEIEPKEKICAEHIFDIFLNRARCLKRTADLANKAGLVRAGNRRWTASALRTWIKSYALVGKREINARNKGVDQSTLKESERYAVVAATWPALVPEAVWEEANHLLRINYRKLKVSQWTGHPYLLTGLVECEFANSMTGTSGKPRETKYPYLTHADDCVCKFNSVRSDLLEQKVWTCISRGLKHPSVISSLMVEANERERLKAPNLLAGINAAKKKRGDAESALSRAGDFALTAESSADREFWMTKSKEKRLEAEQLDRDIREMEQEQAQTSLEGYSTADVLTAIERMDAAFNQMPKETKMRLLRSLIDKVVLYENRTEVILKHSDLCLGA